MTEQKVIKGIGANPGIVEGVVKILKKGSLTEEHKRDNIKRSYDS